jgi:hypothetical protein
MRTLAAAALLFALAACGQASTPAPADSAAAPAEPGSVMLGSTQNLPDWLLVARQRDCRAQGAADQDCLGEVKFNQRTITRNADGTADIWIQVRHGEPQLYQIPGEHEDTTVRFTFERLHYRFNCANEQFVVVERQIMGPNEAVVAHDEPMQIYRAPSQGSVTAIIQPIACRGH